MAAITYNSPPLSLTNPISLSSILKTSSSPFNIIITSTKSRHNNGFKIQANLGGGSDAEIKSKGKKKFITRQEEPEQYWQSAGEREGENPMKTPIPYIIIFGMSTPFIILAIAFANGWIKAPIR